LDLSPEKVVLLGIIALLVLGPHKLPQAARNLGHFMGQVRKMTSTLHAEMRDAIGEPMDAFTGIVADLNPRAVPGALRRAFDPTGAPPPGVAPTPVDPVEAAALPGPTAGPAGGMAPMRSPDDPSLN
jgi:sec-independent protein translocase protein TatB